ncbi:MAG: RluA family pseudouridine synthase [Planctomycetota bacterium]|jgi:23S rRNA pseudouridine1911/1915/1917 synthase|nr:RluA family pseudouridine synthase [Planctomycetota bacterium]
MPANGNVADDTGETPETIECAVPPEHTGRRLDQSLAELLPDRSRAFLQKLLEDGLVLMDGAPRKASRKVKGGERVLVRIPPPEPLSLEPENLPLSVLHEDGDLIVIDKRPGMVAHPSPGHADGTLVNALLHHYGESLSAIGGVLRPGIVHRLDKGTSGCLVAAKNDRAHSALMRQFTSREVEKTYLAITEGAPRPLEGRVEVRIGRNPRDRRFHAVLPNGGRRSVTRYRTLENYGALALVRCDLETGRTHQARVHLAHLGAPVLCDRDYGRRQVYTVADAADALALYRTGRPAGLHHRNPRPILARQALHAWKLAFTHPATGERMAFTAPLPPDMADVLIPLRKARAEMDAAPRDDVGAFGV